MSVGISTLIIYVAFGRSKIKCRSYSVFSLNEIYVAYFSLGVGAAVDLSAVAAVTKGLCGADLEFIVNEAAIRAVRRVSSKLRLGEDPKGITPTVSAEDFENSVVDFYQTRKPKDVVGDILSNVLGKQ